MTTHVTLEAAEIRLRAPIRTARGVAGDRPALIVTLVDGADDGVCGRGEIAPLAGWSTVDLSGATRQLQRWLDGTSDPATEPAPEWVNPQVRAGIDAAQWGLRAARATRPLCDLLGASRPEVAVNRLIDGTDVGSLPAAVRTAIAEDGPDATLKIKMGFDDDSARLDAIAAAIERGTRVRLDPNGAWSVDDAVALMHRADAILGPGLDYVEDPVSTVPELAAVRRRTDVRIASDDLARSSAQLVEIASAGLIDAAVVKPALAGGISPLMATSSRLAEHGVDVVVSSVYDGVVGLTSWCHAAAALPVSIAHGLGTAPLLADPAADALRPRGGRIALA